MRVKGIIGQSFLRQAVFALAGGGILLMDGLQRRDGTYVKI
jgi:hypothetical protein